MLKTVIGTVSRLTARCRRQCSCWCPEEPFDTFTRATYLPNGVRVVTEETNSPLACISLFVAAGPKYETANSNGLTHFIEHLAYKGFKSTCRSELEEIIHSTGARMSVKTRRDMQIFTVLIPAPSAHIAVKYLSQIITDLDFNECELEQERYNICLELMDSDNNPKTTLFDYLHASAFQGTSLGQPVIGPVRNIARFDKGVTCSFLSENYTTCRLILASSGGVIHNSIIEDAANCFGGICPSGVWDADSGGHRFTASEVIYRDDSMPYAHVAIAFEAPGYNSPDCLPMLVMSCLIGSWHKSQGRGWLQPFCVAQEAARENTCESYESFYIVYKDVGLWGAYIVANTIKLDEMVSFLSHAWMDMCVSCHNKEVERAVNMAKLKLAKRYEGVWNSSRDIGTQMMYACTRKSLNVVMNEVSCIRAPSIRVMGEKYIYDKSPVVAGMGPTESLPEYNRIQAGTYWLRV